MTRITFTPERVAAAGLPARPLHFDYTDTPAGPRLDDFSSWVPKLMDPEALAAVDRLQAEADALAITTKH